MTRITKHKLNRLFLSFMTPGRTNCLGKEASEERDDFRSGNNPLGCLSSEIKWGLRKPLPELSTWLGAVTVPHALDCAAAGEKRKGIADRVSQEEGYKGVSGREMKKKTVRPFPTRRGGHSIMKGH